MKRLVSVGALAIVLGAGVAVAQQPSTPPSPAPGHQMQPQSGMCGMEAGGGGMMAGGMGGGMMRGGGMMGMMGSQSDNPRMMQMRGEMMKAMGEVMMKYGKMMEDASR